MKDYVVKLRFWLRAYDSTEISAATNAEAFHLARVAARRMMARTGHPEEIDMEERREGLISYVDTMGLAHSELADGVVFDDDRPLHPEARRLVEKVAVLNPNVDAAQAQELLRTLIAEARSVPTDAVALLSDPPVQSRPWSVDQVYEYRGRPEGFTVDVVDEAWLVHMLDPRFDLRNHSPTGLSWGYSGSGPAQLALAILCHALHCDERAEDLYQEFKEAVVARFDQNQPWRLTTGSPPTPDPGPPKPHSERRYGRPAATARLPATILNILKGATTHDPLSKRGDFAPRARHDPRRTAPLPARPRPDRRRFAGRHRRHRNR